jgi:hypothetical protein
MKSIASVFRPGNCTAIESGAGYNRTQEGSQSQMRISSIQMTILFGLIASPGFCQTSIPDSPPSSPPDYVTYQNFFRQVKDLGIRPLSDEAIASLDLTNQELGPLVKIAVDFEAETDSFDKALRPLIFKARMQAIESESVSPALQKKLHDVENRRSLMILDHVQQLKTSLGESRFVMLNEFLHSGKPLFRPPQFSAPKPSRK